MSIYEHIQFTQTLCIWKFISELRYFRSEGGMEFRQLSVLEISEPATSFCRWESCGPERSRGSSKAMQLDLSQSLNQKEGYYESHIIASQMPGNLDI